MIEDSRLPNGADSIREKMVEYCLDRIKKLMSKKYYFVTHDTCQSCEGHGVTRGAGTAEKCVACDGEGFMEIREEIFPDATDTGRLVFSVVPDSTETIKPA
jgi:DnaJ-class molecular chaperone